MVETVNILDGVDRIIDAINANKKVTLSATVETSPWTSINDGIPTKDSMVLVSTGMEFVVVDSEHMPHNVEYWMYVPALPAQDTLVEIPNVIGGVEEEVTPVMSEDEFNVRQVLELEKTKTKAAKKLGISVATLNSKIKKYNIS